MQLMTKSSEEGSEKGLSWIDAETVRIDSDRVLVPNMGWRYVESVRADNLFKSDTSGMEKFYFVHSYHVACSSEEDVALTFNYGGNLVAGFSHHNIVGVQFHPEKSHMYGFDFLVAGYAILIWIEKLRLN